MDCCPSREDINEAEREAKLFETGIKVHPAAFYPQTKRKKKKKNIHTLFLVFTPNLVRKMRIPVYVTNVVFGGQS